MISEETCDTQDWSNGCFCTILQYYWMFKCSLGEH